MPNIIDEMAAYTPSEAETIHKTLNARCIDIYLLSEKLGYEKSYLKKILTGKRPLSMKMRNALSNFFREDIWESPI